MIALPPRIAREYRPYNAPANRTDACAYNDRPVKGLPDSPLGRANVARRAAAARGGADITLARLRRDIYGTRGLRAEDN